MKKDGTLLDKAKQHLDIAYGLINLNQTLKDLKMLNIVVEHLFLALGKALSAYLDYNVRYKFLEGYEKTFLGKVRAFQRLSIKEFRSFDQDFLLELRSLVEYHKNSSMEFERSNSLVICVDDYNNCKKISLKKVKAFFGKAKLFIDEIHSNIENGRKFF